ncbi:MAG TPA: hypothetical protein VFV98_20255 [Vicinamibacterales bacterium]|nr:hypothetical protein [Vicinamibacterales bacterium]
MGAYTLFHTALSLVGLFAGFLMAGGMMAGKRLDGSIALFLVTTIATNVTAFGFPADHVLPSHVVAALSLVLLAVAVMARYARRLAGSWRAVFVVTSLVSLYFNVFVLIVQLFLKIPVLHDLAPTQSEPPFAITQGIALIASVALIVRSLRTFRAA